MTLLERVAALLSERGTAHALIGAAALAIHGVSRSTLDQDLLVDDRRVLESSFWLPLAEDAAIDIRTGDSDDPLAGPPSSSPRSTNASGCSHPAAARSGIL